MDWGESWASYTAFDLALDQLLEKSGRLSKFLSERAMAQVEYSKKLREIAQKHQQKYNQVHGKHERLKGNQHTSHIAFLRYFEPGFLKHGQYLPCQKFYVVFLTLSNSTVFGYYS